MSPPLSRRRFAFNALSAGAACAAAPMAWGQEFPARPIRLVVPSQPAGLTDVIARVLAERWTRTMKAQVVVDNKPGGTGSLALDAVAKAAPDGYTLTVGFTGANVIFPLLNSKLPFNAQKDFTAIGLMATVGNVLVVTPSMPIKNVNELLAHARAQPKDKPLLYGSWGNGSGGHLAGEYLKLLTGVNMLHVPARSMVSLVNDLLGGHLQVGFLDISVAAPQVAAGKLRAVAITGPKRPLTLPEVPTLLEQGVAFGIGSWVGLFGPAGMPAAVVNKLNAELREALLAPDLAERWVQTFGTPPTPGTPQEFEKTIRNDWDVWKRVVSEGHITAD